jgi:hypothetical protein
VKPAPASSQPKQELEQPPPKPQAAAPQVTKQTPPPAPAPDEPKPLSVLVVDTAEVMKDRKPAAEPKKAAPAAVEPKKAAPPATAVVQVNKAAPAPVVKQDPDADLSLWARLTGIRKPATAQPTFAGVPQPTPAAPKPAPAVAVGSASAPVAAPSVVAAPAQPPQRPAMPTGSASWYAAAATPPPRMMMMNPYSMSASAPNAFTVMVPGGPAMPQQMPMMSDAGVPTGLNNAFTQGGSPRPMPPDMGRSSNVPNGLQGPGQMGGAEFRPPLPSQGYYVAAGYYPPQAMMMPAPMPPPQMAAAPVQPPVVQASLNVAAPAASATTMPLQALRDALMPSERELAVEQLRRCDWRQQPEVIEALTKAAKSDPAPTVRAACVRALAKMKVNTVPVVAALVSLKEDSDLRVRQEVEQALAVLMRP